MTTSKKPDDTPAYVWSDRLGCYTRTINGRESRLLKLPNFKATCTHTPHGGDACGWCGAHVPPA